MFRSSPSAGLAPTLVAAALVCASSQGCDVGAGEDAGVDAAEVRIDAGSADVGPFTCPALPASVVEGHLGLVEDTVGAPRRRLVLMGGSAEVDAASRLFVEGAGGGDVLVLRATGSVDSYTPYFHQELAADPAPASVTTLRTDLPEEAGDAAVRCRVGAAEALWIAGGDQWDYLGGWPDTLHVSMADVARRGGALGGTSAGAMVLGEAAFDAAQGGLTSVTALADPIASIVSVSIPAFSQPELAGHLVDTHFSQRDREGRLLVFVARMRELLRLEVARGIGIDERAAIVLGQGSFEVLAEPGRSVWVYEVGGVARLEAGAPLELEGVTRVRLGPGDQGAWPLDLGAWSSEALVVRQGSVEPG